MGEILDIIDEKSDPKEALQSIRDNFLTMNKQSLRAGSYLLSDLVVKTAQAVQVTDYVVLGAFSGSFASSGGLVFFDASVVANFTNVTNRTVYLTLFVDDVELGWALWCSGAANAGSNSNTINLERWLMVNAGNHKWQIKAKVASAANPCTLGSTTDPSTVSIIEFLRG